MNSDGKIQDRLAWVIGVLFALVASYLAVKMVLTLRHFGFRWDFNIGMQAAQRLWRGEPFYVDEAIFVHVKPPFSTFFYLPFIFMPILVSAFFIDACNISLPWLFARRMRYALPSVTKGILSKKDFVLSTMLALVLGFNSWMSETLIGQYNLLLMFWALSAGYVESEFLAALFIASAIIIKPNFVLYFFWVFWFRKQKQKFILSGLLFLLLLASVYSGLYGVHRLIEDHQTWQAFMQKMANQWADGSSSLASLIWRIFGLGQRFIQACTLLALGLSVWVAVDKKFSKLEGFCLTTWFMLALLPSTWRMNYSMTIPLLLFTSAGLIRAVRQARFVRTWVSLAIFQFVTNVSFAPLFIGNRGFEIYNRWSLPFWFSTIVLGTTWWLTREELRLLDSSMGANSAKSIRLSAITPR